MAITLPHKGSWGLPDFGITEAIQKIVAPKKPVTAQGGSNLFGPTPNKAAAPPPTIKKSTPPAVQGASTYSGGGFAAAPAPSGGSSGGGQQQSAESYTQSVPGYEEPNFDAMIQPALDALDQSIAPLQQDYEAQVGDINAQRATRIGQAQTAQTGQETELGRQEELQKTTGESAADEARRQYSELQQGLQSRYGGTTGTGGFAAEYAGAQTLKNIANIRQTVATNLQAIGDKLGQVKEIGKIAIQDIEDKTNELKTQAKEQLDGSLNQIRQQKGELQSRKAELASQAFQIYQNTVNQINSQNAAFKQNVFLKQQDSENALKLAMQKGQEAVSNLKLQNIGTPNEPTFAQYDPSANTLTPTTTVGGKLGTGVKDPNDPNAQFSF